MGGIHKIAVVIPFYKQHLTKYEKIALTQCFKILPKYPIFAIQPQHLTLPGEVNNYSLTKSICFANDFFVNIAGYNRLMLDAHFYKEFLDYDYILIYQLDAFVFKDDLEYWCNNGLDYIGAPWLRSKDYPNILKAAVSSGLQFLARRYDIKKHGLPSKKQFDNNVGNGGFSLRRVKAFYDICIVNREKIAAYNNRPTHHYNEDAFWGIEVNRKKKILNIPDYKTALKFAFELAPARAYRLNDQQLPLGCHAWDKHIDFWRPIFKEQGYEI